MSWLVIGTDPRVEELKSVAFKGSSCGLASVKL